MFEYKGTEKFDIGAGYGENEYDFFVINDEDDFLALMNHYGVIYRRFDYFLDGYETIENNTSLSPIVQEKMKKHNANLCLTLFGKEFNGNNAGIKQMIVNELMSDKLYNTHFFYFYYFTTQSARNYLEQGLAYAKSNLHTAAIRYFSCAIKLDTSMGLVYYYRGISYLEKNDYYKAIKDFTQAINFDPEESKSFSLRGLAYKEAGDLENAREDFAKALKINPNDEMAKECLEEIKKTQSRS